jgi:hypothetical protein
LSRHVLRRIGVSAALVARDLARSRVAVALLIVVPTIFYLLIRTTTGHRPIPVQLSGLGEQILMVDERELSLLFIGMAAISGLSAFLSFVVVLRAAEVDRRLVFEGYHPAELLVAKLVVISVVALVVALYVTLLLPVFFRPSRAAGVFLGFLLTSLVYGVLGMAVGALARRELEGILLILLLVNIDAGWLQNPAFYAHAHNQQLLQLLPGHFPGQVTMLSAFTTTGIMGAVNRALAYAAVGLGAGAMLYRHRVRVSH